MRHVQVRLSDELADALARKAGKRGAQEFLEKVIAEAVDKPLKDPVLEVLQRIESALLRAKVSGGSTSYGDTLIDTPAKDLENISHLTATIETQLHKILELAREAGAALEAPPGISASVSQAKKGSSPRAQRESTASRKDAERVAYERWKRQYGITDDSDETKADFDQFQKKAGGGGKRGA